MNDLDLPSQRKIQLKELSPKHKQVAALLAQGVDRETIGVAVQYEPEYVTWLGGDPLFRQYVREMGKLAETRLEAMFEQAVDVIASEMRSGGENALKAARMQMEATGRIGKERRDSSDEQPPDYLEHLAGRLVKLLNTQRQGVTYEAEVIPATET